MGLEGFKPFETASYPCFFLADGDALYSNAAAQSAGPPFSNEETMRRWLQAAKRGLSAEGKAAGMLPLPTGALALRSLSLMAIEGGLLAVALEEAGAPVRAFSSQMREPLTNIFSTLPILASRLEGADIVYAEQVQAGCYQLLRLAANLENAHRLENGLLENEVLDLAALVASLCECARPACQIQKVPLTWQLPETPVPVLADRRLFSEAFLNLIRNSLQYTRDGNAILVKLAVAGGQAVLTVQDEGLGVREENLPHIFEPYFSADPYGDNDQPPGLGLGLAVVREAARCFGGTASAESRFGEGTRMILALPLAQNASTMLGSDAQEYLADRYSPVYIQLCGYCRPPALGL